MSWKPRRFIFRQLLTVLLLLPLMKVPTGLAGGKKGKFDDERDKLHDDVSEYDEPAKGFDDVQVRPSTKSSSRKTVIVWTLVLVMAILVAFLIFSNR